MATIIAEAKARNSFELKQRAGVQFLQRNSDPRPLE
jgi:hypothetical protein